MSGHNKWSKIKNQKMGADAKRGQLFTKFTREIIIAVKNGGTSTDSNRRLALAIQKAKGGSMPGDNIQRAIEKGAGTAEGMQLVEMVVEGYGPNGAAIMVQAVSDNRNRAVQEIRSTFTRNGGALGGTGTVAWQFEQKGLITIDAAGKDVDDLTLKAIEAGADDVQENDGSLEIYTKPEDLYAVSTSLTKQNVPVASAELSMLPKITVELDEKASLQTLKLLDKLEELDDVQHVYSNVDFSDEILDKYKAVA
jgi:YebC/PmpR family DNA-binding regulatory protein